MIGGLRPGQLARGAILLAVTVAAIDAELWLAPRTWDIITYAQAYAAGQVAQGWSQWEASKLVARTVVGNLAPVAAIAACPVLAGWLLGRWK